MGNSFPVAAKLAKCRQPCSHERTVPCPSPHMPPRGHGGMHRARALLPQHELSQGSQRVPTREQSPNLSCQSTKILPGLDPLGALGGLQPCTCLTMHSSRLNWRSTLGRGLFCGWNPSACAPMSVWVEQTEETSTFCMKTSDCLKFKRAVLTLKKKTQPNKNESIHCRTRYPKINGSEIILQFYILKQAFLFLQSYFLPIKCPSGSFT